MPRVLILGGGAAGLFCGYRLKELKERDWGIVEAGQSGGGLARSKTDSKGFVWDVGGHTFTPKDRRYAVLFESIMKKDYLAHDKNSFAMVTGRLIRSPFQKNISALPSHLSARCTTDFMSRNATANVSDFENMLLSRFGRSISELFLLPYNRKAWKTDLKTLNTAWVEDSMGPISLDDLNGTTDTNKQKILYPARGGFGSFFERLSQSIHENILFEKTVTSVDIVNRVVRVNDSEVIPYEILINTLPLNCLLELIRHRERGAFRHHLVSTPLAVVGIGLSGKSRFEGKSWIYVPNPDVLFHRITFISNFSHNNAPVNCWSLMCEITPYGAIKDVASITRQTISDLRRIAVLQKTSNIESTHFEYINRAYPVPMLLRDDRLRQINGFLNSHDIFSIGRFGSWIYERSNTDCIFTDSVALVDRLCSSRQITIE